MAAITIGFVDIDGVAPPQPNTEVISPPAPWTVDYTVGGVAGVANVVAILYQINDNAAVSLPLPLAALGANSFQIDTTDLPASGQYLLTIIAFDDQNNSATDFCQITLNNVDLTVQTVQGSCCT